MANAVGVQGSLNTIRSYEAAGQLELLVDKGFRFTDALGSALEIDDTSGAISSKNGIVMLTKGGVAVMTLAAPTAGSDDGKILRIVSTTAQAHTVTCPTGKLNGSALGTFAAAIGNGMTLLAYNGIWYVLSNIGVTIS